MTTNHSDTALSLVYELFVLSPIPYSCQDYEDQRQSCEVQGAVLQVSLHLGRHRQREGRQTEAVPSTW